MANFDVKVQVVVTGVLELNEDELQALSALAGYGTDAFLKTFYEKMGRAYLQPYEKGLRSLFNKATAVASPALAKGYAARKNLRVAMEKAAK